MMKFTMIAAAGILSCVVVQAVAGEAAAPSERTIKMEAVGVISAAPVVPACPDPDGLHELRQGVEKGDVIKVAAWMEVGGCALLSPGSYGFTDKLNEKRMASVHFVEVVELDIRTNETIKRQQDGALWLYVSHLVPLDESLPSAGLHNIWVDAFAE